VNSDGADNIAIEPLHDEAEARLCAALMARSEPWLTLKRDFDHALALLLDKTKEVYVARAGKALVGHIVVNMQGAFVGYIQVVAVAEDWRGRGIGERLVRFAEERIFRDSPNVFLCVSSFNPRAQNFYTRLGYERVGELKDYVIAGASEFLMRKTIGPRNGFKPRH
jgi:ribosomal protein S18 acetylase RimI-like enzyme